MAAVGTELYDLLAPQLGSADNGSFFAGDASTPGFVADPGIAFGANWRTNLKWQATTTGDQTNFWVNIANGDEEAVGVSADPLADLNGLLNGKGTFTLDRVNQTLTWKTATVAVVPEASTYAMVLVGLATMGLVVRRRRAQ
ncbi:MAG: PEP-CTERM sorting domain-containing protein [Rubrivivax sp.]|nr:MAG: PEP-CTERM sorting domain-containing protein [Rubrivivax sp.]